MLMDIMEEKRGNAVVGRNGKRTTSLRSLYRTGMTSTIQRAPTAMRHISIAMRRYERLESGRIGCMPIDWRNSITVMKTAMKNDRGRK